MKKIALILSGCGYLDGAEIHESVLAMLAIEREGATYQCFAPNINQHHVVNHLTGDVIEGESRNVLIESARIARGDVSDMAQLSIDDFDALVLPGGFGVAKNLCDFAFEGANCNIEPVILEVCKSFAKANKPAGYLCISPAMLPLIYGKDIKGTLGNDPQFSDTYKSMGGNHYDCDVTETVIDSQHKVVSSPAYMLATSITEAASSIDKLIQDVIKLS